MAGKIAYIMSRFPHLPETFILREMQQVKLQGLDIAIYPIVFQEQPIRHEDVDAWLPELRRLPFFSREVILANFRQFGHDPWRFVTLWGRVVSQNVRSPNFLMRALALFPKAVYAAELMQAEGIQHVHAHYASHPALAAWIIHQLTGIHYSVTVHAHDIFVRTAMLDTKLRDADFVAAISTYNRDHLAKSLGLWAKEKTRVIHCGVEPDKYESARMIGDGDRLQLINVGSLEPYKGQAFLIEACALLEQQGLSFRCRIVGEGEERDRLQALINKRGLAEYVQLLGARTQAEVAALLSTAHCYVQPSIITPAGKMEGIPVALMEALACRLPVIASDLSGVPELIQHGVTGYLVPPADPASIARMCQRIYQHPLEAAAMARAGCQLVKRDFNLATNVGQLVALFEQVMRPGVEQHGHPSVQSVRINKTTVAR